MFMISCLIQKGQWVFKLDITDAVLLNCYYYLKDSKKYSFIDHLPDMGKKLKSFHLCKLSL